MFRFLLFSPLVLFFCFPLLVRDVNVNVNASRSLPMVTAVAREGKKKISPYVPGGVVGMAYTIFSVFAVSLTVNYLVIPFQVRRGGGGGGAAAATVVVSDLLNSC